MHKEPEVTRLIHENLSFILSYAFSRSPLLNCITNHFKGEWKYLRRSTFELAEIRADRALLELATQLRILDDRENIGDYFRQINSRIAVLGLVIQGDGEKTDLYFRDMTNKIIHGSEFKWECEDANDPRVICISNDPDRWKQAEVSILRLATLIGGLGF